MEVILVNKYLMLEMVRIFYLLSLNQNSIESMKIAYYTMCPPHTFNSLHCLIQAPVV